MSKNHAENCRFVIVDAECDCDGYHTFPELYEHRMELFVVLCRKFNDAYIESGHRLYPWKSKAHSDGTMWGGWFIMGLNVQEGQQITYHLPITYWELCSFAQTLERAPKFDGHTSEDVLYRLRKL